MSRALPAVLLLLACAPAGAQYEEDDQTRDYERQDSRYQQRVAEQQEVPPTPEEAERQFVEQAESLIRDKNYNGTTTERYRVQTDDPRVDPRVVARLLETFRSYFDDQWSGRLELESYDKQSRVFLFYSFFKYNQLLGADFRMSPIRPAGHYGSLFDAITVHTDADGDLANTLVHEATHQLVDQRFGWRGRIPLWLSEGLASYYGYTQLDGSGEFQLARIGGKRLNVLTGAGKSRNAQLRERLNSVRKAVKTLDKSEDSLVEYLLSLRAPSDFYGSNPGLNYGASWLLVHCLLHGDDGTYEPGFVRYLEREIDDRGGSDALLAELGMTYETLDAALVRHVAQLKVD